jgi:phage shock protein A
MVSSRFLAGLLLFATLAAFGADDDPILSTGGKRKTEQYLRMLAEQAHSIQESLGNIRRNIKILRDEIAELDGLEREHLALLQKVEGYSKRAQDAVASNELSMKGDAGSPAEKSQREAWKKQNETVVAEFRKTAAEIRKSLAEISSRRSPLKTQLQGWMQREKDYSAALEKVRARRLEVERMVAGNPR